MPQIGGFRMEWHRFSPSKNEDVGLVCLSAPLVSIGYKHDRCLHLLDGRLLGENAQSSSILHPP